MNRRKFLVGAVTLPVALRFAPGALAGGTPVALVTADTQARVAVVCHTAQSVVSLIDGPSLRVRRVQGRFDEPRYTAAGANARHAFVTDSGTSEVVAVDIVEGRTLGRLKLDEWARHVTSEPSGRRLWVGLGSASERVAIVDVSEPRRPRLERMLRPPFLAHDVGYEPSGARVWVTSGTAREVAVYDVRGRLQRHLAADAAPQHVTFSRRAAYVTSGNDGTLRLVSLTDGRELRAARVPVGSYHVQSGHAFVVTPSLDTGALSVLDRAGRTVRELTVASSSHDACFLA